MFLNCGVGEDSWVPWTARTSNQSILKEISPECSLEGLMLKLKLQYLGHLMRRADLFEKTLILGNIEGRRRRGQHRMRWMASPTQWTWVWVNSGSWWWTGRPGVLRFMGLQRVRHDLATELNWTERPVNFIVTSSLENGNILRSVARTMGRYTLKGLCIFHRGSVKIWQVYI